MSRIRKMPTVAKTKGKLTPHGVEDKKATRVSSGAGPHKKMPHGIKTPDGQMPNKSMFHNHKVVKEGKHMATAGGVGHATKRVAQEQATSMFMSGRTKKAAKKRKGS